MLYLNHESKWNGPLTLKGCLDIPPQMDLYVHDYGINLYEIGQMTMEEVNRRFHGDFRIVAEFFVQKRMNEDYNPQPQVMQHAREVIQLISAVAGDHRYEEAYNQIMSESKSRQEGVTMCTVYDQIENKGIKKGLAQGLQEGLTKGRQEGIVKGYRSAQEDTARSMRAEGISLEQIARILHTDVTTVLEMLQQA